MPFRNPLLLAALPALALVSPAFAQTAATWNGGAGLWLDAPNWSPAGVPDSDAADVRIDNSTGTASVVTFGYVVPNAGLTARIGRLRIDAGDRLEFSPRPNTLRLVDTAFTGAGTIQLDGVLALPFTDNYLSGPKTLTGTGRLVLGGTGQRPEITNLTVTSITIEGSAAFGRANASNFAVLNSGLIDANRAGQDMDFHGLSGANRSVNTGTMRSTNGGKLLLGQGEWLNTGGTILADGAGSLTAFYRGGLIEGGTLSATNGGLLQVGGTFNGSNGGSTFRDLTVTGPTSVLETLLLRGTITNNGVMTLAAGGIIDIDPALYNSSNDPALTVTLAGSGQVVLDNPSLTGTRNFGSRFSRWLIQNQTIRGRGQVGDQNSNAPWIINRGTFQADRSGDVLRLSLSSLDNEAGGVLRAQAGGILRIASGGALKNTGGTIEALSGGRIEADFGRVEGGLVRNLGGFINLSGLTLVNPGTRMRLEGDLTVGGAAFQETRLVGDIENVGTLRITPNANQSARIWLGEPANRVVTLRGGGQIVLGDPSNLNTGPELWDNLQGNAAVHALTNLDNTIRGFGRVGNSIYETRLDFDNRGLVQADVNGKTLSMGLRAVTNPATFRALNGGRLELYASSGFDNTSGTVRAEAGSTVSFASTTIIAGLVASAAGGTLELVNAGAARGGVLFTNAGTLRVGASGGGNFDGLSNGGSDLVNAGTVRKVGGSDFSLSTRLNSTGAFVVEAGILRCFGGGTLVANTFAVATGTELTFQGAASHTFSGVNTFSGGGMPVIVDTTTLLADAATELRAANFKFYNGTLAGPGVLAPTASGPLLSHSGQLVFFENTSAALAAVRLLTPAGAEAFVDTSSAIQFSNGTRWENQGTVTLRGYGPRTVRGPAGTLFRNALGGVVRYAGLGFGQFGDINLPSENFGRIEVNANPQSTNNLYLSAPSRWEGGTATIAAGANLLMYRNPMTLVGTANATSGAGLLAVVEGGSLAFTSGSRLAAERVQFNDNSGTTGAGELRVSAAANFLPPSSTSTQVIDATTVNLLVGSTSLLETFGTLRFQNGAILRNAGTLNMRQPFRLELNGGAVLENSGTLEINRAGNFSATPTVATDGTGLYRALSGSVTRFESFGGSGGINFDAPIDVAGSLLANNGYQVTFTRGGLLNEVAKISPVHASSGVTFTGATPLRVRGQANEFNGLGYVNLRDTTLQFEPSSIAGNASSIAAGARVSFQGNNTVKGTGTISTTGFVFQTGDQTVETATLETFGTADVTVWNATGRRVEFKTGAQFRNGGRFVIQFAAGGTNNPGFTGEAGTRFHNLSTGTLVSDTSSTTQFNLDFQNDGELEVRAGKFEFLKSFSGTGGVAASGGGKITLPLGSTALAQLPGRLRATGAGSEINVTLPGGDKLIRVDVNGGKMVAAGGGNLVAAGGMNMVAAGGGNLVAAGGMNMVAAGGGNITASGLNTLLSANNLIGNDGSTLIGNDGSTMVAAGGMNLTNASSASFAGAGTNLQVNGLIGMDGSTLIGNDGSTLVAAGGMNLTNSSAFASGAGTRIQANSLIGNDGSTLIGNDGSTMVAAGGGNRPGPARAGRPGTDAPGDPGTIVVATGSTLAGNGTFQGAGYIQSTASLRPGKPLAQGGNGLGALPWTGSLQVDAGATLFVELGGTVAGTQHDRINISGAFTLNGALAVSFLNGFGASVGPADAFDIVVSQTSVASALAGTRVPVAGTYGSFLVSIVNGGTTLRLANFQIDPVTFSRWAQKFGLNGPNASPTADPNGSGLSNLMKYALGLDPASPGGRGTAYGIFTDGQGNRYLTLSYTKPTGAETPTDLIYLPERASALSGATWSASTSDVVPVGDPVPGPGNLQTVTVRSTHPVSAGTPRDFLRLRVSVVP